MPQIVITLVFFYWPASQAVWQSFLLQDAFGLSTNFIWIENYRELFAPADYYRTIATTLIFSGLGRGALALDARCCSRRRPTSSSRAPASTARC